MAVEAQVRLLICHMCKTINEIPSFDGPAEYDDLLAAKVAEHQFPSGKAHPLDLGVVAKEDWDKPTHRQEILRHLHMSGSPGTGLGMGDSFYDVKANYEQDAITCWKQHGRTTDCGDYMSDSKKLLPDTAADRRAEGLSVSNRKGTKLCQFCPVQSVKMQAMRKDRGDYDKKSWESS
jgi:hypothetical protein